jgi:hypothetical protein
MRKRVNAAVKREAEEDWGKRVADMKKCYVAVVATMIATVMFALPADARPKKQRPDTQKRYQVQQTPQSLDGRTLGRMRTCGFDYLQYDGMAGTPVGPYCH